MKILQVINSLSIGGAERLITDTVPALKKRGVAIDVLCLKNDRTAFWKKLEAETGDQVFGLTKGSLYNPLLIFKLIPFIKKYDIVHVHLFPALYWVVLAKWISFSKVKIIVTEHNTKHRRTSNELLRTIDRLFHQKINRIVTISDKGLHELKKHLKTIPENRFKLIYNGIDLTAFYSVQPYSRNTFFSESDFIVTQVSNFRTQKDQPTLIKALLHLPENVKLILIGQGKLQKENEELVHQLNLEDRVLFLGGRTDVARILSSSDVIVLSSVHEGFGLAIVEGMASHKPCVASRIGGLSEIVEDYGLLFPVGDVIELAGAIFSLYNDSVYYQQVADKCYQRAQQFSIETMVNSYIEVYQEVMGEVKTIR